MTKEKMLRNIGVIYCSPDAYCPWKMNAGIGHQEVISVVEDERRTPEGHALDGQR